MNILCQIHCVVNLLVYWYFPAYYFSRFLLCVCVCVCFFKEYRYLRGTVYILMPFFSWRHESYLEDMYQEFGVINAVSYFVIMWGFLSEQILPNTSRDTRNKDPASLLISFFNIAYFTILPGTGAPHSWIMWKFKRASTWKW